MDRKPPTRKPHAAIGSSSSSSSSSSAGDQDEAEQPPIPPPVAVGAHSTFEEGTDDDEHEEAELPPTKNTSIPAPAGSFSASEDETSSSSADEHEAEQRRAATRYILAPAGQGGDNYESDDDDDDDESVLCESSYVPAKRGPSRPRHLQGPPEPQTLPERNASSPELTKPSPMKRTAAAAELAEASSSKKKAPADGVPSKSPPPEKPAAAREHRRTKSSSSSEDSSDDDEREVEQRPTTKTPILAPSLLAAGQEGDSPDGDDEEEEEDDEGELAGSANVTAKRGPSPLPHLQGVPEPQTPPEGNVPSPKLTKASPVKRTAAAAELAEPSLSKKQKKKALGNVTSKSPLPEKPAAAGEDHHTKSLRMAMPTTEVTGLHEKAVAAKKAAKLPKKAVATRNVAEPPAPKKAAAAAKRQVAGKKVTKPPPPSKAAAAVARQATGKEVASYNAEKHLEEKTETFWHLAETLNVLERKHKAPGLYNAAFLSIADNKAAVLDAKIKKQTMDECKLFLKRCDIEREIMRTLSKLI